MSTINDSSITIYEAMMNIQNGKIESFEDFYNKRKEILAVRIRALLG